MALMCFIEVLNTNREMSAEEFKAWLRRFDFDGDGRISREELKESLRSLQVWFGWWKARQGMRAVDSNRNGQIDGGKEIENLVIYAQKQLHMKIYDDDNDFYR